MNKDEKRFHQQGLHAFVYAWQNWIRLTVKAAEAKADMDKCGGELYQGSVDIEEFVVVKIQDKLYMIHVDIEGDGDHEVTEVADYIELLTP